MGKVKRHQIFINKQRQVKEHFVDFLAKIGNRAAQQYTQGLSAEDLEVAMKVAQDSFGKPDMIIVDPEAFKAFRKLTNQ